MHEKQKNAGDGFNNQNATQISNNISSNNINHNNASSIHRPGSGPVAVHYLHELPHAEEERYAQIFNKLDRNGKQKWKMVDVY